MRRSRNITMSLSIILMLLSCSPKKRVDTSAMKKEMATREIKKVTAAEIMIAGEQLGMKVLDTTQKVFQSTLMTALSEKGTAEAISYCHLNATKLIKTLEDSLGISIRRVTDKPRNHADTLSEFEKRVFEAYQFAPELATSQIQELNDESLILNKPIRISNGACLSCHGGVGDQVTAENYALLKSLYPNDLATGYQLNDLRGMWTIIIPKKAVINHL